MRIKAINSFHNTTYTFTTTDSEINASKAKRVREAICAAGCICFADHTRYESEQGGLTLTFIAQERPDGGMGFYPNEIIPDGAK